MAATVSSSELMSSPDTVFNGSSEVLPAAVRTAARRIVADGNGLFLPPMDWALLQRLPHDDTACAALVPRLVERWGGKLAAGAQQQPSPSNVAQRSTAAERPQANGQHAAPSAPQQTDRAAPPASQQAGGSVARPAAKAGECSASVPIGAAATSASGAAEDPLACCAACGKRKGDAGVRKLRTCTGCRALKYCSTECQHAHWDAHKAACKEAKRRLAQTAEQQQ